VPRLLRLGVSAGKAMNLVLALVLEVAFKCIVKLYIFQFLKYTVDGTTFRPFPELVNLGLPFVFQILKFN
jgi:hypothetical protein